MKIGIIGTRGIPNNYGGFEQFAENFSTRMADKGHEVTVYASHRHPYKEENYRNVRIVRCYDPEHIIGTPGQFIYDLNCIRHSRSQGFDIILQLGYTSSTIWSWLYPKSTLLVTNMDGLEWSRAKYNKTTQQFLKYAEKWGVNYSHYLIADSKAIQEYLLDKYNTQAVLISYGAEVYDTTADDMDVLAEFSLVKGTYDLLIARFEPENNVETVLKAYARCVDRTLVLVGNYDNTAFGKRMYKEYGSKANISFAGAVYDAGRLNALRYHSRLYLHGHSVGGTNPSLLEAMAASALICAHDNRFNRCVLGTDAFYFKTDSDIQAIIAGKEQKEYYSDWLHNNREKIWNEYNWNKIIEKTEGHFNQWMYGEQYREVALAV